MGWSGYLVDKKNKIRFECFKVNLDCFLEIVNKVNKALKSAYRVSEEEDIDPHETQAKAVKDLNMKDVSVLYQCLNVVMNLAHPLNELLPSIYYIYTTEQILKNEEVLSLDSRFDYYTDFEDDKYKKYKNYKLVTCYAEVDDE